VHAGGVEDRREAAEQVRQRQQRRPVNEPAEDDQDEADVLWMSRVGVDAIGDEFVVRPVQRDPPERDDYHSQDADRRTHDLPEGHLEGLTEHGER
jgi:hypothetical protein